MVAKKCCHTINLENMLDQFNKCKCCLNIYIYIYIYRKGISYVKPERETNVSCYMYNEVLLLSAEGFSSPQTPPPICPDSPKTLPYPPYCFIMTPTITTYCTNMYTDNYIPWFSSIVFRVVWALCFSRVLTSHKVGNMGGNTHTQLWVDKHIPHVGVVTHTHTHNCGWTNIFHMWGLEHTHTHTTVGGQTYSTCGGWNTHTHTQLWVDNHIPHVGIGTHTHTWMGIHWVGTQCKGRGAWRQWHIVSLLA